MIWFYSWGEISIDWNQWAIGGNWYPREGGCWNVFIGPVRIGGPARMEL